MRDRIRAAIRRWLGIEGQTWKHAMTSASIMGMRIEAARAPTPPTEPGNWELVAVAAKDMDYVFWWKAPMTQKDLRLAALAALRLERAPTPKPKAPKPKTPWTGEP